MPTKIFEFLPQTLIDYPGKIACEIFTPGCNYRCPACHNKWIVDGNSGVQVEDIFSYLQNREKWIDGIVISGGEPTIHELKDLLIRIRNDFPEIAIKIDTNGSNPNVLRDLLKKDIKGRFLIDCVALDVKAPFDKYKNVAGKHADVNAIRESMRVLYYTKKFRSELGKEFDYEFRTTIVPIFDNGIARFMMPSEIENIAREIVEITGSNEHKYYLQKFVPRKDGLIDSRLESFQETPDGLMEECLNKARIYLPNVRIR